MFWWLNPMFWGDAFRKQRLRHRRPGVSLGTEGADGTGRGSA